MRNSVLVFVQALFHVIAEDEAVVVPSDVSAVNAVPEI